MQNIFLLCVFCVLTPLWGSSHQAVTGFSGAAVFSHVDGFRLVPSQNDSCKKTVCPTSKNPPVVKKESNQKPTKACKAPSANPALVQSAESCDNKSLPSVLTMLNDKFSI